MKKSILLTIAACLLISCGSKTGKAVSDTDSLAADSINGTIVDKYSEAHEKAKTLVGDWGWVGEGCPELLLDMEMTDKGLRAKQCDVYRMYGFDKTTITFDGKHLTVNECADDELSPENQIRLFLHFDQNGDLVGDCTISHRLASKGYDGPIRLRKGYFYYRDGVK